VVDQCSFQAGRAARGAAAVHAESGAAPATSRRGGLGNDQIDGHEQLLAGDVDLGRPDARLHVPAVQRELKARRGHRRFDQRVGRELLGVDGEVGVGGERRHGQITVAAVQVDRLRAGDDQRVGVRRKGEQRVEQHAARGNVARVDGAHDAPVVDRSASERARHWSSWSTIHDSSASPSAGIRPLPLKQSTTTCDGAA